MPLITKSERSNNASTGACGAALVRQASKVPCIAGRSFGCVDACTMWVAHCRGVFQCAGRSIECGYAMHRQHLARAAGSRALCSCAERCVQNASAPQDPGDTGRGARHEPARARRGAEEPVHAVEPEDDAVAIVQYETRPLLRGTYWAQVAALNEQYARVRNLSYRLYRPHDGAARRGCFLNGTVRRATTWCKLLVVAHSLRSAEVALWMDSDAYLKGAPRLGPLAIDRLWRAFRSSSECGWFFSDRPWHADGANCGVFLWRRRADCLRLLYEWWMIDVKPMAPYHEQEALNKHLLRRHRDAQIRVLQDVTPMLDRSATQRYLVHVSHAQAEARWQRICSDAATVTAPHVPSSAYSLDIHSAAVGQQAARLDWWLRVA
eukprot:CAMPEP_0119374740 /NCGR_PEP_ID=MMETSP1334-20130426/32535_1 /TAXON_ID=127549 /ORGANISM="Calcidiscus leptoporus, Strain RCC1130" /LENGTH=377 /DNA_ID=CAMNT_0007392881 /DNA_START=100 /DNA_END=1233 /DNA_ORIENTATION=+